MKYVDEYRDNQLAQGLLREIRQKTTRPWVLMEICGGQTHTIMRYGLDELLPSWIELVHGPGCPVCVTPASILDRAIELAQRDDVILVSYGDLLRVPGTKTDLFSAKARGADVRMVYSPLDALRVARLYPDRKVVFLAVGFETTAPANAMAVYQAHRERLDNFFLLASHVLVPPAIRGLAASPDNRVQGFIAPGHVCTIVGCADYADLVQEFHVPIVVGGFEPVDLLQAILALVTMLEEGRPAFANEYARSVSYRGNLEAQRILGEIFEVADQSWRGLGEIPQSGLRLREKFAAWDADKVFDLNVLPVEAPSVCISAEILKGLKKPTDCSAFGTVCTPASPLGAPMVSSEGACSAYYQYRRHSLVAIQ
ncbi:hydrogenase formation protein HypD [Granulicella sp. 5B5]|uniref:hydrogenase formation protein HypD n=1 Tax=Granulicella sp. 5B5 TaxID=1617967 RepID=UPI0015F39820|nr:hydrogenase formation protein HypD [Granulicella sp. 5B5]QMV19888.1 hydrogenase formation protein HypD [Granulicella sp. 5B5]